MSKEQSTYLAENGIEHQTSMPDSLQRNGQAEKFQQTIINGAEAMRHHAGLSNGLRTLVQPKAKHLTPKSLWVSSMGAHSKKEET